MSLYVAENRCRSGQTLVMENLPFILRRPILFSFLICILIRAPIGALYFPTSTGDNVAIYAKPASIAVQNDRTLSFTTLFFF